MIVEHLVREPTNRFALHFHVERKRNPCRLLNEGARYDASQSSGLVSRAFEELGTIVGAHHAAIRLDRRGALH